jgi:hypothetical protein
MELGLFWLLAQKPLPATDVAHSLNIPLNRGHNWLQVLCKLGLLESIAEGYAPSTTAREAILLPGGIDMVLLCDVGEFGEALFCRIRLAPAFVDSLAPSPQSVDFTTADVVHKRLQQAGFHDFSLTPLPHIACRTLLRLLFKSGRPAAKLDK